MKKNIIQFLATYILYKIAANIPVVEAILDSLKEWKVRYHLVDILLWVAAYAAVYAFLSLAARHEKQTTTKGNENEQRNRNGRADV